MRNFIFSLILILFLITSAIAQNRLNSEFYSPTNIFKFANYLFINGEYHRAVAEYERYLFTTKINSDSINFKIGLCYYLDNQFSKSLAKLNYFIESNPASELFPDAMFYIGYIQYKLNQYELSTGYISKIQNNTNISPEQREQGQLLLAANQLTMRSWKGAEKTLSNISTSSQFLYSKKNFSNYLKQGQEIRQKNPFLAATFSALIPGSGKIYVGRTIDGLFSFFLLSLTTWQAHQEFSENTIKSTKGWIFTSIGTVFYLGNIYGSAIAAKIYNQEVNNEFEKQIRIELHKAFGH